MFESFSSLFDASKPPRRTRRSDDRSPFSSPYTTLTSPVAGRRDDGNAHRRIAADFDGENDIDDGEAREDDRLLGSGDDEHGEELEEEEDHEDGNGDETPLLPIFSAAHLDSLPTYNLTHSIRLLVVSRVETTLTWDQLRSPQVSQFLVKPIQQQIRSAHFSRATEYALMANCLQFTKEVGMNPGLSGNNKTRAMVCELIAMRLLKEFSTRELIDALAYDFDPLQGQGPPGFRGARPPLGGKHPRVARTSCLEVAIRASAKRFLAHPLVVQQLEAIWAGSIVFHSAADSLHRKPVKIVPPRPNGYGAVGGDRVAGARGKLQLAKQRDHMAPVEVSVRRSVTLYDPRDASLFKLSRLRVPRYRNIVSTVSFAILLSLFVAVLVDRSLEITPLEILFWIWSAGYMLDELVGFSEQGFSLYLASFWNTFDLGILLLLLLHLCMRIYGIVVPDVSKHRVADMAYDILAAAAVLLFPRLFSVLDHYRYFSQLLIAFRIMTADFLAIFVLIVISCSGFFVALTLSFGNENIDTPGSVAYALLQLLMGFTPAAWERWHGYNVLGKLLLVLFMFITHFLVVTILITVLTNSFMSIVQNANEEHQFLFAVNTISMVKSDSLFSYVAPTNILGWLLTPLRYFIPFRRYVKLNRTIIKMTHFPILFTIFLYEKTLLRSAMFEPTDLVEVRGRSGRPNPTTVTGHVFSPRPPRLVREPSIATYHKDQALEEVFRRPFRDTSRNVQPSQERHKTSNAVNTWMNAIDEHGVLSPPVEQDRSVLDHLESGRSTLKFRRPRLSRNIRDFTDRSVASNPEDYISTAGVLAQSHPVFSEDNLTPSALADAAQQTDADGDDELLTNEPDEDDKTTSGHHQSADDAGLISSTVRRPGYFNHPSRSRASPQLSTSYSSKKEARFLSPSPAVQRPPSRRQSPSRQKRAPHLRNVSAATILYNPISDSSQGRKSSSSTSRGISPTRKEITARNTASARTSTGKRSGTLTPATGVPSTPAPEGRRTPKRAIPGAGRNRPAFPASGNPAFRSVPNLAGMFPGFEDAEKRRPRTSGRRNLGSMDIGSDIGDNKAIGGGWLGQPGGLSTSYTTQTWMDKADPAVRSRRQRRRHSADDDDDHDGGKHHLSDSDSGDNQTGIFGRLMLARMNNLEEGFREVVTEMRDHLRREDRSEGTSQQRSDPARDRPPKLTRSQTSKKEVKGKEREHARPGLRRGKTAIQMPPPPLQTSNQRKGHSEGTLEDTDNNEWVDEEDVGGPEGDTHKTASSV